jgi:TolA-binding protein
MKDYNNAANYYIGYAGQATTSLAPDIAYRIGYTFYHIGDYTKATGYLQEVALEDSDLGQYAAYYMGASYLLAHNQEFAIAPFQRAAAMPYESNIRRLAQYNLSLLYYETELYPEAIRVMQGFLAQYPGDPLATPIQENLTRAYLYSNDYDRAIRYIESLPSKSDTIRYAYQQVTYLKGIEYFNNQQYNDAVELLEKSIRQTRSAELKYTAAYWLAEAYSLQDYADETTRDNYLENRVVPLYREIVNFYNPTYSELALDALYGLGYAHYNLAEYPAAAQAFEQYLQYSRQRGRNKYVADASLRLADSYYGQRQYTQALNLYNEAISTQNPEQDYALYQRAMVYALQGDYERAATDFAYFQQLRYQGSRYFIPALYQLANVNLSLRRYAVAVDNYTNLLNQTNIGSFAPDALLKRSMAYRNISRNDLAIQDCAQIIRRYPTAPVAEDALYTLQQLLRAEGRGAEAAEYMTLFAQANPGSNAAETIDYEQAKDAYFNQQYQEAVRLFERFLERYPQSSLRYDAAFWTGDAYARLGEVKQARQMLIRATAERKGNYLERALRRLASLEYEAEQYRQSINYYFALAAQTQSKRDQVEAWLGIAQNYERLKQADSSMYFADLVIKQEAGAALSTQAQLVVGKNHLHQSRYSAALDLFEKLYSRDLTAVGAEAQYLAGKILHTQKRYNDSNALLLELTRRYGSQEYWRGKAFLLIAENYIANGEIFQAKSMLQSIVDNAPDPNIKQLARTRLQEI